MMGSLDDDPRAEESFAGADRAVKIERLLLSGLDHFFQKRYEHAIDVWTRVLFFDRSHARARAYIERARAALAETLRESEELVHTGVEAFERGNVSEARSLLTSAVERGGGRDEALSVLDRLNRLEAAAGDGMVRRLGTRVSPSRRDRTQGWHRPPARRVRVVPLVLFTGAAVATVYLAVSRGLWEPPVLGRPAPLQITSTESREPVPVPSGADVRVARARRLVLRGHLHEALGVLEGVGASDPLAAEVSAMRAVIQRRLLAGGDGLTSDSRAKGGPAR